MRSQWFVRPPVGLVLQQGRASLLAIVVCAAFSVAIAVFFVPPTRMTGPAVQLITSMVWPLFLFSLIVLFRKQVELFALEVTKRVQGGADLTLGKFIELKTGTLPEKAARIPAPLAQEPITLSNVALLHTSFIPKSKAAYQDGFTYLQIEVIVIAPDSVMERIERVTYRLDDAYPETSRERVRTERNDRFKLKELANGTSIVRAEIQFSDQEAPVFLNRFIDLRPDGPRI